VRKVKGRSLLCKERVRNDIVSEGGKEGQKSNEKEVGSCLKEYTIPGNILKSAKRKRSK
jgi:hypothetical protein